uniref:CYCLIN domain-containing protein n=2 Tax=Loa loa TaxID=7209 RepID=A0A1I7VUN5_LOALO
MGSVWCLTLSLMMSCEWKQWFTENYLRGRKRSVACLCCSVFRVAPRGCVVSLNYSLIWGGVGITDDAYRRSNRTYVRKNMQQYVPMLLDRSYVDLKNQVIKAERKLLNALGFVVHVNHPHKLIYAYLHALGATGNHELMQKAWSYMNDGLRTDIFLRYRPETIACACIHLAARTIAEPLPLPREPFPWFEAFDASDRDVHTISVLLLQVYARIRAPNWTRLNDTLNKLRIGLSNTFAKAQQAESIASKEVERAKAILEKRRREIASKAAEMERQNGARSKTREGSGKEKEVQRDREKENDHHNAKQTSSSASRSHSKSPIEPKKFRSSIICYHHRAESTERDRPSKHNHHHSRHQRDERRRAREERRAEKDRRHRTRSRDGRRKVVEKDRVNNQREREKDVYLALGKRRRSSESPSPVKVRR